MTFLTEAEYTYAVSGGKKAAGLAKKTKIRASVLEKKKKNASIFSTYDKISFSAPSCCLSACLSTLFLQGC